MNLEPITQNEVSEREKQASYITAHMRNLKKLYWLTYFVEQYSSRDSGVENRLVDTVSEGEGGAYWESSTKTYI